MDIYSYNRALIDVRNKLIHARDIREVAYQQHIKQTAPPPGESKYDWIDRRYKLKHQADMAVNLIEEIDRMMLEEGDV